MKKFMFVMPLMAISLLGSCNKAPEPQVIEHFVTFESYGGGHFPTQRVKDGDSATKPENSPIRGDDTFLGWFTDFDKPAYTFTEAVTDDITLYAGWEVAPDPVTSFRFKFTGHDCKVNGLTSFECDIGVGAQTQFAIIPDGARSFPPKDSEHWIVKEGDGTFTYDPLTGYIKIGNMTSNIEIEAFASGPATKYNIGFTGVDCKAKGESITVATDSFQIEDVSGGKNYSFVIEPNSDYVLDGSISTFLVNGEPSTAYEYTLGDGGKYNLSFTLTGNTLISIVGKPTTKYNISFTGTDCKAKGESITTASETFQIEDVPGGQNYSFVIEPNSNFALDGSIGTFLVNGTPSTAYEYTLGDGGKYNLSFTLTGNTLISIVANPVTYTRHVSFNMTDCAMMWGTTEITSTGIDIPVLDVNPYYVKFSVKASDNIYMKPGTLSLNSGAYTDYSFNKEEGDLFVNLREDVAVTGLCDIYKSLEECSWAQIKTISEAKEAPNAFHIGDEKTVEMNNKEHRVRIIGFNHDDLADGSGQAGITFEFANIITKSNDEAATTIWDGEYAVSGKNFDYRKSVLNDFLNNTGDDGSVINMLPSSGNPDNPDLREVIKPVDKKVGVSTDEGQNYTAISFDGDVYPYPYLFPLAHDETAAHEDEATNNEGSKYQYYVEHPDNADRIKRKAGVETGNGEIYLYRSPFTDVTSYSWVVSVDGGLSVSSVYNTARGVAPAFCI